MVLAASGLGLKFPILCVSCTWTGERCTAVRSLSQNIPRMLVLVETDTRDARWYYPSDCTTLWSTLYSVPESLLVSLCVYALFPPPPICPKLFAVAAGQPAVVCRTTGPKMAEQFKRGDTGINTAEGQISGPRAARLAKQRQQDQQEYESKRQKIQVRGDQMNLRVGRPKQ